MSPPFDANSFLTLLEDYDRGVPLAQLVVKIENSPEDLLRHLAMALSVYPKEGWLPIVERVGALVGAAAPCAELFGTLGAKLLGQAKTEFNLGFQNISRGHAKRGELALRASRHAFELSSALGPGNKSEPEYQLRELNAFANAARAFHLPRCEVSDVLSSFDAAKARHPHKLIIPLTDSPEYLKSLGAGILCSDISPEVALKDCDFNKSLFFYAFDMDCIGETFASYIIEKGGQFYPVTMTERRAKYWHIRPLVYDVLKKEFFQQHAEGIAKWDDGDFLNIVQMIDLTAELPGDYVEVGTFYGSSAAIALSYMEAVCIKRRTFFLDVFEGFNYPEAQKSSDQLWVNTHSTPGRDFVAGKLLTRVNDQSTVNVIKANIMSDPLPSAIEAIAVANLDVDMYEAVLAGLHKLGPKIVPGGVLIVEDCGHTPALIGARVALTQFLATATGKHFIPVYMESGQTMLFRKGANEDLDSRVRKAWSEYNGSAQATSKKAVQLPS